MDNQLPSPNTPATPEQPTNPTPEIIKPNVAPAETAPAASSAAPAATPAKLSPEEVAAAINATPTAGTPAPGAPAPAPAQPAATPLVAADVDVIEPEWVDKVEATVRETQGDPYAEEEAIEKLQEDYLQKRYGINVAHPNGDDTKPKGP